MHFSRFFIILGVTIVTQAIQDPPAGIHFVGVGYNILKGNPEGGDISFGGVDPGLLLTRKIFKLTYEKKKSSTDLRYRVPDQVSFAPRSVSSCQESEQKKVVAGTKSYQDELKLDVTTTASYDAGLWNAAFSLSSKYQRMENETKKNERVFYDFKKICNRGQVRYLLDSAHLQTIKGFSVTDDFAAAVCSLSDGYQEDNYLEFIERWGTDVVLEVTLGQKNVTRFESSRSKFYEYAMENIGNSLNVSGEYEGYKGSLEIDMNTFKQSMKEGSRLSTKKMVLTTGGADMPEPIKVRLMPIYKAIDTDFFKDLKYPGLSDCDSPRVIDQKSENVKKILKKYPELKEVHKPEDDFRIPLTWPKGTYGLPMPRSGCPELPREARFRWNEGTRKHDTEDLSSSNSWSRPYHLAGSVKEDDMEQKFCIKTRSTGFLPWPKGTYCIFKKGRCPGGFEQGWIKWDDEDSNNKNSRSGTLPDGKYNEDTKIEYCCRNDSFPTNEIILPTDSPFVLFSADDQCQSVKGMRVNKEFFKFDTEDWNNSNNHGGFKPRSEVDDNIKLHYCYYELEY